MTEPRICPTCKAEIPSDAPPGVCPFCALRAGYRREPTSRPGSDTSGTPPLSPEELSRRLPELEDFSLIGPGGMDTVYRASTGARAAGRREGDPRPSPRARRVSRTIRSRSAYSGTAGPSEHRQGLRFRAARGPLLFDHGAGRWRHAAPGDRRRRHRAEGGAVAGASDLRGAAVRARPGNRPPRHQARQHPARSTGRSSMSSSRPTGSGSRAASSRSAIAPSGELPLAVWRSAASRLAA